MSKVEFRRCSKCGEEKPADQFYSLGEGRLDSWCKACKKASRRAGYVKKEDNSNYRTFRNILEFIHEVELTQLSRWERQLEEIISHAKCQISRAV